MEFATTNLNRTPEEDLGNGDLVDEVLYLFFSLIIVHQLLHPTKQSADICMKIDYQPQGQ